MKKYFKYLISTFIFTSFVVAQVTEGMVEFRMGKHNALRLILIDVDEKLVDQYGYNLRSIDKSIKKIEKAEKGNKSILKNQAKTKKKISDQGHVVEELRKLLESMK